MELFEEEKFSIPFETILRASISNPESVSSNIANFGFIKES